jgi:hypothetical protein
MIVRAATTTAIALLISVNAQAQQLQMLAGHGRGMLQRVLECARRSRNGRVWLLIESKVIGKPAGAIQADINGLKTQAISA